MNYFKFILEKKESPYLIIFGYLIYKLDFSRKISRKKTSRSVLKDKMINMQINNIEKRIKTEELTKVNILSIISQINNLSEVISNFETVGENQREKLKFIKQMTKNI